VNGLIKTTPCTLGRAASLRDKNGLRGTGHYLLTGAEERTSSSRVPYLRVTLEDASGRMIGSVWPEHRHRIELPALQTVISVSGLVKVLDYEPHLNIERLFPTPIDEAPPATDLLPRHRCPAQALPGLDALAALERTLPRPLDSFLKRVLLDPAIGVRLLRCRASVSHHHAFEGGLLAHSTQMLDIAAALSRLVLPNDPTAPAMTQLGLVLHDLGKLRSVGETRRPQGALVVSHEFITIELLAPHIRWLERQDFELALGLRYLLSYLATPRKARTFAKYAVAEIIERLDELSAATHNARDLASLTSEKSQLMKVRTEPHAVW
jgi:3'-5' exoribonuclease